MRQIWLLALNDLRLTARDRPAFLWMIVMPVAMMWFIGGLGGGGGSGSPAISLGVVNHDDGWVSEALIEELTDESVNLRTMTPEESALAEDHQKAEHPGGGPRCRCDTDCVCPAEQSGPELGASC